VREKEAAKEAAKESAKEAAKEAAEKAAKEAASFILKLLSSKGIPIAQADRQRLETCTDLAELDAAFMRSLSMGQSDRLFA
jgi:hypothetical protein